MLKTYERIAWFASLACVIAYMAITWSKSLDKQALQYDEEITRVKATLDEELRKLRAEEQKKIEQLTLAHEETLKDIEREHSEKLRALNERKAKQTEQNVQQFNDDPRVIADKIANMLPGVIVR